MASQAAYAWHQSWRNGGGSENKRNMWREISAAGKEWHEMAAAASSKWRKGVASIKAESQSKRGIESEMAKNRRNEKHGGIFHEISNGSRTIMVYQQQQYQHKHSGGIVGIWRQISA